MQDEKYSSTLNLFQTSLPIRSDFEKSDIEIRENWEKINLIEKFFIKENLRKSFILHDGPPYANGPIHLGHAYNKILKDIVSKSHRLMGYNVSIIPGWDCHGLPIEKKVSTENPGLSRTETIKKCREYAFGWIENQKKSFKELGVFMDWNNPYITMSYQYEADTLRAFSKFVENGFITRANKAIPWCCGCQTTLASAEIEYKEKKDPSLYVLFEIKKDENFNKIFEKNEFLNENSEINFLIWTTTPWTLPLNRGISLKENAIYCLAKSAEKFIIFGKGCLEHLKKTTNFDFEIIKDFKSEDLKNLLAKHPFDKNLDVKIILGDHVEDSEGTACVHTAPGCGPIDYEVGIKNNLEVFSPISPDGKYEKGIYPEDFVGMSVSDGQIEVIKKLNEKGKIFFKNSIRHSYPHCWRSHEPLIFRATPQWFFQLTKNNFKEKALNAVEEIEFFPKNGKNFLKATVGSRWEWCLSRQRVWGVPITAFIKNDSSYLLDEKIINKIADKVEQEGIEYWNNASFEKLKNDKILPENFDDKDYKKEDNILDVWFDSGVSHFAVLNRNNSFPADIYLEGIDQHRGWFQSSILTSVALTGKAPMKTIVTHGFTVDEKGQKMSKSIGNVIAPEEITKKYGTDGLRIWAAIVGNDGDAIVSETILKNAGEVYRKIRNTCRYMLQNVVDFDLKKDGLNFEDLHPFDLYALRKLYHLFIKSVSSYQKIEFSQVVQNLSEFCSSFLSTLYFDGLKDILYCNNLNDKRRRSIQTSFYYILETITKLMSPILSHTSDLIAKSYRKEEDFLSIHLERFSNFEYLKNISDFYNLKEELLSPSSIQEKLDSLKEDFYEKDYMGAWDSIFKLRDELHRSVEKLREQQIVKQSVETSSEINFGIKNSLSENFLFLIKILEEKNIKIEKMIEEISSISEIKFNLQEDSELKIKTEKHNGKKCPRCWRYFYGETNLCKRCSNTLN